MEKKIFKYKEFINELFDTEDLKTHMETDYLKGDLPETVLKKWKGVDTNNPMMVELHREVPFLDSFFVDVSGKTISFGLRDNIVYSDENAVIYDILIEIIEFRDTYYLNAYFKCYGNNKKIYSESLILKDLSKSELFKTLNTKVKVMVKEFDEYLIKMFKVDLQVNYNIPIELN